VKHAVQFLSGLLFGAGLAISGMTSPENVRGFLDFFGRWNPALAFVMGGAVLVHALTYRWVRSRATPIFETSFAIPTRKDIDRRLVWGAALFGVGWGIGGYCPGPAITSLVTFSRDSLLFVASMLGGMILFHKVSERLGASARSTNENLGADSLAPEAPPAASN
jgi:hypothetical protein